MEIGQVMTHPVVEIIPAVLPKTQAEFDELAARIEPFAKTVQLDIVDGVFDDDLSWPYASPGELTHLSGFRLPYLEKIFWEVDLMVREPRDIGLSFVKAGASRIIAHVEAFTGADDARSAFEAWQQSGAQAGVSLLIDTPISTIEDFYYDVQLIQVMGIAKIGAQGEPFDERAIARVRELRTRFPEAVISVDGGIDETHVRELVRAGANRLVVGSAIIRSDDPRAAFEELQRLVLS